MVGPVAVDTPDYQRGIVSAQKQLAFVDKTSDVVTVGVPPNAETLVIATPTNSLLSTPVCLGLTTALNYPAVRIGGFLGALGATHWMFDISSALDAQVQITWPGADGEQWWVYADSGVRLTVNPTQTSNQLGQQYVIPSAPSIQSGDHPPVELSQATIYGNASTAFINAPGAGKRLRLFYATLSFIPSGTGNAQLVGTISGTNYILSQHPAAPPVSYHPSGLPMADNDGLRIGLSVGGTFASTVVYTTETI